MELDADLKEISRVLGYYSIAICVMTLSSGLSNSKKRKLIGSNFQRDGDIDHAPCYLIGQMGKDDWNGEGLEKEEVLSTAITTISEAHDLVGGRFIKLDCSDVPELIEHYERHGFEILQKNEVNGLNEMVMYF